MILKLSFLVFIVLQSAKAQNCIPDRVTNLTLELNYTLHWQPSTNCEPTLYQVYVRSYDYQDHYVYHTSSTQKSLEFLNACERYHIQVRAQTNSMLSDENDIVSYIPAPSGADLSITTFTASLQPDGSTFLNWQVTEKFAHCAQAFRLVIHDSYNPIPRDLYTDRNNMFLNELIPCGQYQFAIMAIYNLESEGPINLIDYVAPEKNPPLPELESIIAGDTYVNISWNLPSYSVNRCTISALEVNGLPFLHQTFPINDSPQRPIYTTSLTNLQPENMYMLRVSIINSAGPSEPFPIGVQTLPAGSG